MDDEQRGEHGERIRDPSKLAVTAQRWPWKRAALLPEDRRV